MRARRFYVAAVLALAACAPNGKPAASPPPSPVVSPSGLPPITIHSRGSSAQPVQISMQQGNRRMYELQARSTESTLQSQSHLRSTFSQTHITFFNPDGSKMIGEAPLATIDKASQRVLMQGGVHAKTSDGIVLTCDQLEYSGGTSRLRGTGNVHIVSSGGYSLTGNTFTSDLKLTNVHMQ